MVTMVWAGGGLVDAPSQHEDGGVVDQRRQADVGGLLGGQRLARVLGVLSWGMEEGHAASRQVRTHTPCLSVRCPL